MHISIDTSVDLSGVDKNILLALVGDVPAKASSAPSVAKKATPAKKAAAAKPAPEPEPEPVEEDLLGGDDEPTLDDAVAKATAMVADGKAKEVKAALNAVGAAKVSALAGDQIAAFLAEVED